MSAFKNDLKVSVLFAGGRVMNVNICCIVMIIPSSFWTFLSISRYPLLRNIFDDNTPLVLAIFSTTFAQQSLNSIPTKTMTYS